VSGDVGGDEESAVVGGAVGDEELTVVGADVGDELLAVVGGAVGDGEVGDSSLAGFSTAGDLKR
jgi:hypothetical protein